MHFINDSICIFDCELSFFFFFFNHLHELMRNKKYVCHLKMSIMHTKKIIYGQIKFWIFISILKYKHFLHHTHHIKYTVRCLYCALILHAELLYCKKENYISV